MKGRNNYLCKKKLYDLTGQPVLSGLEEIEHYRTIAAWEQTTQSGDRAELASLPEMSALWHKLDARADTCLGQKCSSWDKCFITEMRRRAAESDIIIVNHHLFFADLGIKQQAEGAPDAGILPDAGIVIFDEAHELEDVAGSYFGISVSAARLEELCRDVEGSLQRSRMYTAQLSGAIKSLRDRSGFFFSLLPVGGGFEYIRGRLGVEHAREEVLPSHFDYQSQALFYVPPDLPDPRTPQFGVQAAERIRQLLEISRGRAFVLFTSYAQMRDIYQRLLGEGEFPMLLQVSAPKNALLAEFRLTANCVLFATSSFWQGVDVQGDQLSCVIID